MPDWLTPEQRSRNMAAIRSTGTKPEARLGALLRTMFPRRKIVQHPDGFEGKPDYYIPSLKLVVFADGCFWHGCPRHGRVPGDNNDYWAAKLARNRARDRTVSRSLRKKRYVVVRVWEHELKGSGTPAKAKIRRAITRTGNG